jgi:hypothetical protein
MGKYVRVLPRDLFNEASLLKLYGRLWIALDEMRDHVAAFVEEDVDEFDVSQDEASGAITIANITFTVAGVPHRLERPLNSRAAWPLWVEASEADPDFDPVRVFDDEGALSAEMLELIGAGRG